MTIRLLPSTMKWLNRPGREAGATGRCGRRPLGEDGFTPTYLLHDPDVARHIAQRKSETQLVQCRNSITHKSEVDCCSL